MLSHITFKISATCSKDNEHGHGGPRVIHESLSGGITDFFDELHIHFERLCDIYYPLLLHSGIQTDQTGQHHYGSSLVLSDTQ